LRRKFFCILMIVMIICAVSFVQVKAQDTYEISAEDIDGHLKAYFFRPVSVASAEIDGKYTLIIGDRAVGDNPDSYARLVIYTDDGGDKSISEYLLEADAIPTKLEIYNNFLFVYNDKNKSINIYDISDIDNIMLSEAGVFTGIDDFSVFGDTLFVLVNYDVERYLLSEDGGGVAELAESYSFADKPSEIAAISETEMIVGTYGSDPLYIADMEGNYTPIEGIQETLFYSYLNYHNGVLYYYSDKTIYAYNIEDETTYAFQTVESQQIPLSEDIKNITNIYADESGVYITDRDLKKVVKYYHNLNYSGFCLCSFSNDEGRFNAPASVNSAGGKIAVADSNRIQIIDGDTITQYYLGFKAGYAFLTDGGDIIAIKNNNIYRNDFYSPIEWQSAQIKDAKLDAEDTLFILTDTSVYTMDDLLHFEKLFDISGGIKLAVNNKTHDVYVLTQQSILIYKNNVLFQTIPLSDVTEGDSGFVSIETDFEGNIYLLCQDYDLNGAAIVKIDADGDSEVFLLGDEMNKDIKSLSIDYINGDVYFVSESAHAVYKVQKSDLDVAVASDIPQISLPANPENSLQDYIAEVIIIGGYPSTMFYPFSADLSGEDFYPQNLAYEGEIIHLQSGATLLSIYDNGQYRLAFYEGKLGFVLSDNIYVCQYQNAEYTDGETLLSTAFYSIPYITSNENADYLSRYIDKWERVSIISRLPSYDQSLIEWLYIEYNGERGYISADNVMPYNPPAEMEYITGNLISGQGVVNLYSDTSEQSVLLTLEKGSEIKIYYYIGNYAYISAVSGEREVFGYISRSSIAPDYAFQKQKMGFLMLFGTLALGIIIAVIKRKYL
jgi:hypothetical protein